MNDYTKRDHDFTAEEIQPAHDRIDALVKEVRAIDREVNALLHRRAGIDAELHLLRERREAGTLWMLSGELRDRGT